jgi:hypothetical protein
LNNHSQSSSGQVELLGDGVDVDVQLLISGTCSPVPSRRRRVRPAPVENGLKFLADRDKAAGTQARLNVKFGLRRAEPVLQTCCRRGGGRPVALPIRRHRSGSRHDQEPAKEAEAGGEAAEQRVVEPAVLAEADLRQSLGLHPGFPAYFLRVVVRELVEVGVCEVRKGKAAGLVVVEPGPKRGEQPRSGDDEEDGADGEQDEREDAAAVHAGVKQRFDARALLDGGDGENRKGRDEETDLGVGVVDPGAVSAQGEVGVVVRLGLGASAVPDVAALVVVEDEAREGRVDRGLIGLAAGGVVPPGGARRRRVRCAARRRSRCVPRRRPRRRGR